MNNDHGLSLVSSAGEDNQPVGTSYRLVARGEIDLATAPQLADSLQSLIDQGATLVVLDTAAVHFLDSSGLRVIINSANKLSDAGGRLLIEGMSGAVQRVLEVSGVIERYRS